MSSSPRDSDGRLLHSSGLTPLARYQLMTSLIVPRPIAWVGSRSTAGVANLAPFSYFAALSANPMLVGVSVGNQRDGRPKDTLQNIRETSDFSISLVTMQHLEPMNQSSATYPPEVDEFAAAGVECAEADSVSAPYVADAPAVLECSLTREVEVGPATTLVIGEVHAVRLREDLSLIEGSHFVDVSHLQPVARLWGTLYAPVTETISLDRPSAEERQDG